MKKLLLTFALLGFVFSASAQTAEEEVQAVIETLFDGMKTKNVEMVASAFDEAAMMQTVIANPDGSETRGNSVADFLQRIGETPEGTTLNEKILDYQIKVDGTLASAWTPYEFYVNEDFSHCGVNSFQLVKKSAGWKIVYIIDTRHKEGCK